MLCAHVHGDGGGLGRARNDHADRDLAVVGAARRDQRSAGRVEADIAGDGLPQVALEGGYVEVGQGRVLHQDFSWSTLSRNRMEAMVDRRGWPLRNDLAETL